MVEQMMIAQEPREPVVMAHHAACIEKQEDPGNVIQRIGHEEHGHHGADALKGRFEPVACIGIQESRFRFRMMDGVYGRIQRTPVQNQVGHIEPDIVTENREENWEHFSNNLK